MMNARRTLLLLTSLLLILPWVTSFVPASFFSRSPERLYASPSDEYQNVKLNEFFKSPVPRPIKDYVSITKEPSSPKQDYSLVELATAPPGTPGVPRPLWLVILASLPTGFVWYGYYKFCVEEELLEMELSAGKAPRGFGGYGTLGPFTYGLVLGPVAAILHFPGGINWTTLAIVYIYYTQFLLYDRVNELYEEEGLEKPLTVWWCLPIFFPFNLIVGLRQVHFLSQYLYNQRGVDPPPSDPVADFFPFIKAPKFTWQQFLTTPRLWCCLLSAQNDIDRTTLPEPVRDFLAIGEDEKKRQ
jgi:hypothetical protein